MRNTKNTIRFTLAAVLVLVSMLFHSCTPSALDEYDGDPGKAKLMIYNVMPSFILYPNVNSEGNPITSTNNLAMRLYLDNVLLFAAPLNYDNYTGYFPVEPGPRIFRADTVRRSFGSNSSENVYTAPGATVVNSQLTLAPDRFYTLFIADTLESIETVLVEDDLTPPPAGKAKVRFAHFSPDAPPVDVTVKGGGVLFSNQSFKEVSAFQEVDAGIYTLQVGPTGSTTLFGTLNELRIDAGKIYTVVVVGELNPQKDEGGENPKNDLDANIILNYYVYP